MTISRFIKNDFQVVDAYEGISSIRHSLSDNNALVVMDQNKPVGMLTANDVLRKPHNLVIDCMMPKPGVSPVQSVREALSLMRQTHTDALPVYDDSNTLMGVIYKNDIVDYLCQAVEKQQSMVQLMVHDLKSPLANIISINELLQHEVHKEEDRKLLDYSKQSCEIATDIINDLLVSELVEHDSPTFTITELGHFLKACLLSVNGLISKKQIVIDNVPPPQKYYFRADRGKLQRALHNVLYNAIKFTPVGGTIHISSTTEKDRFTIMVKDNGIGIPESDQPYIFNKFTRAKRTGTNGESSTGLGMYITKQIVEQHNGEIWFKSKEGEGTSFFIRFNMLSSGNHEKLVLLENEPH
ncbi:sensor histidine kinase [Filimonas effusa]|uniref:histidine kinase n=1 Tax=Filimonas effusa TaxID=2508721 RepID=A0A4Q1DAU7_9BACT|nr:HAMP domain-containing sensor histidine kinase [Filimonas effusa]RXK86554.1 HAMP domain-containing histidine kinase [Filimonas effusa]